MINFQNRVSYINVCLQNSVHAHFNQNKVKRERGILATGKEAEEVETKS